MPTLVEAQVSPARLQNLVKMKATKQDEQPLRKRIEKLMFY